MIDYSKLIFYDTNSKYSKDEKINFLKNAIKNGGFYDKNNKWNSIIYDKEKNIVLRGRVETLVIKYNKFVYLKFLPKPLQTNDFIYLIPGGSFEKDNSNIQQAINECREEAYFDIENVRYTGIHYIENRVPPKRAIINNEVNWNALYNEVYVADYKEEYTEDINSFDKDSTIASGKFYNLYRVYKYLKPEHKKAIDMFYPDTFNSIYKNNKFYNTQQFISDRDFGIPSQRKFPIYDKYHTIKSIENFNSVDFFHEKELAYNINKKIKLYNIDLSKLSISNNNRIRKYL